MVLRDQTVLVKAGKVRNIDIRSVESDHHDIIEHFMVTGGTVTDGDALVLLRRRGSGKNSFRDSYHPTTYFVARLMPVADIHTSSFDNPLYRFPRSPRAVFQGHYRVIEIYMDFEPGRHRGMVRAARALLARYAKTRKVNWKKIRYLDGIKVER